MNLKTSLFALAVTATSIASAEILDRPGGIRFGENDHLILRPYVSFSYTFDSNVDHSKHSRSGSQWVIAPNVALTYYKGNWDVRATAYYQYHNYNRYTQYINSAAYGQTLAVDWSNALPGEKGWFLQIQESYRQVAMDDDMSSSGGRGIWRDRQELNFDAALQRRINEHWHATFFGDYYLLDYENDKNKYGALYGWKRANLGGQLGFTASKWTDVLLAFSYQAYEQDNDTNRNYYDFGTRGDVSKKSEGYSLMGGIGTHATEKLKYRLLAGWSRFDYGSGTDVANGFTYQASANWMATRTLSFSLLGSSYYQPSERYYSSSDKVYTMSLGASKTLIHSKLKATADVSYRKEECQYAYSRAADRGQDIISFRAGLTYSLNRFIDLRGSVEYQSSMSTGTDTAGGYYDYDRWRGTLGFVLKY